MFVIKKRSLVPNLVTCYSKDVQRDWIEYLKSCKQMCKFLKIMQLTFLKKWRNTDHMKYRYKIIGRLISIGVL